MIHLIWAEDEKGAIGKDGALPWRLPNDLKFFKETTLGYPIVMGRKTFESMNKRPLPKRENFIITRQSDYYAEGVTIIHDVTDTQRMVGDEQIVFVIGGSEIYRQFLPIADVLHRTKIKGDFSGDTFFPEVDWTKWKLVEEKEGKTDEKNIHPHVFQKFIRTEQ